MVCAIAAGLTFPLAAPAAAAPSGIRATCTLHGKNPELSQTKVQVKSSGSQLCSGNFAKHRVEVSIQKWNKTKKKWETKATESDSAVRPDDTVSTPVRWTCAGTGTQKYRVTIKGTFTDTKGKHFSAHDESNAKELTCRD